MDESRKVRPTTRSLYLRKVAAALCLLGPLAASAQISLSTAVDFAEKHSAAVRSAKAEVDRAAAALSQTKDAYYPTVVLGSSVGPPPYGFPLGNPDIYDVNADSLVFSFSQPDYVRAARSGVHSATLSLKDTQRQVALDVALAYVELDEDLKEIAGLKEENGYAETLVQFEKDRVQAGVDPRISELQAELTAAQVNQKRVSIEDDADLMRQKLGNLTGLPDTNLKTDSASIPPLPSLSDESNDQRMASDNPGIAAAYALAQSKLYTAFGDERQNLRPSVGFGLKYQRFAKFQNFELYYRQFQQNNISAGVQMTIPLFDRSLNAKARQTAAEAARARADADASLDVLREQTFTLRGNVRELAAQQRVAQVQSQIAQEQLKSIETQLTSGTGLPNAPGVPPTQSQKAHIQERQYYSEMIEADLALMKVELNLMKMTGQIDDWVSSSLH